MDQPLLDLARHQQLSDLLPLVARHTLREESAEPAELAGILRLEIYPIRNIDLAKCPYGFCAVIYASDKHEGLRVTHLTELRTNWFRIMAAKRLQGLPIMRKYSSFYDTDNYYQCVFASPQRFISRDELELGLIRSPWRQVIEFIKATKL
jgi:hypothetical protein